jgi:hypothetical protein
MEFIMRPRQHTYLASGRGRHWRIVVGWDNPLETFYAQVWEQYVDERPGHEEREELELWMGLERREIGDLEELEELVEPYGPIPGRIRDDLEEDHARWRPSTGLELALRRLFGTQ